jgi:hypothetical protein
MDGRECIMDDDFEIYGTTNPLISPLPLTDLNSALRSRFSLFFASPAHRSAIAHSLFGPLDPLPLPLRSHALFDGRKRGSEVWSLDYDEQTGNSTCLVAQSDGSCVMHQWLKKSNEFKKT